MNREGLLKGIGIGFSVGFLISVGIRFIFINFGGEDVPFPAIFTWGIIFFAIIFSVILGAKLKKEKIEKIPINEEVESFFRKSFGFGLLKENKEIFKWAVIGAGIGLILMVSFHFLLTLTSSISKKEVFISDEIQKEIAKKVITSTQKIIADWEEEMYKEITWKIKDADENIQIAKEKIKNGSYDLSLGFVKESDALLKNAKKDLKKVMPPIELKDAQSLFNSAIDKKIKGVEMMKKGLSKYNFSIEKINQGTTLIKEADSEMEKIINEINSIIKGYDLPAFWWEIE